MTRRTIAALPWLLAALVGCDRDTTEASSNGGIPVPDSATAAAETDTDDVGTTGTGDVDPSTSSDGASSPGGPTSEPEPQPDPEPPVTFDLGMLPDAPDIVVCGAPNPVSCDDEDDDPWHALGLNCTGGPQVDGVYNGDAQSLHVHAGNVGTFMPAPFPPREGEKIVIISSGNASQMLQAGTFMSTNVTGAVDNGADLPAPLLPNDVSATEDCVDNPGLVGTGDCSNTVSGQWTQGGGAYDYAELRLQVEVPGNTFGFSYDLAMFSTEYPVYYHSQYNDMYIAWLESEQWTGNVSFDEAGNPISLNAGFLDYKDAPNTIDCPAPCTAPELQGTAMEGHAGTKWLTTTAPVTPGEEIEVVFAVFDMSDPNLDTVVLLDNWLWSCEGGPPVTIPG
jgi:hypothetical protein